MVQERNYRNTNIFLQTYPDLENEPYHHIKCLFKLFQTETCWKHARSCILFRNSQFFLNIRDIFVKIINRFLVGEVLVLFIHFYTSLVPYCLFAAAGCLSAVEGYSERKKGKWKINISKRNSQHR